ncbi:MAG: hypothetical protein F6K28_56705 [Microcoleus sp. SIO2G3]|nr:hypothetical protein [Microcoleus sp. SIO2G3]
MYSTFCHPIATLDRQDESAIASAKSSQRTIPNLHRCQSNLKEGLWRYEGSVDSPKLYKNFFSFCTKKWSDRGDRLN